MLDKLIQFNDMRYDAVMTSSIY